MANSLHAFPSSLEELVVSCIAFYKENQEKIISEDIRKKRASLCGFVENFHENCGTLTSAVRRRIKDLRDGSCVVLMTAHQPNLFAYSGVFRKATLNFVLAKRLEKQLNVPVVNFFGIADQDFADDRWVKSAQLPDVKRKEGVFNLQITLPEKIMLNKVAKPSEDIIYGWRKSVEKWLEDSFNSVVVFCGDHGVSSIDSEKRVLYNNFKYFWSLVEDAYERCSSYSDFNGFLISKIINEVWQYDTLFSRFSECQQVFASDFSFLLSHFTDYSKALKDVMNQQMETEGVRGVSSQEPELAPFWYQCDCGSKVKLLLSEQDGSLVGCGECLGCQRSCSLDFGAPDNPNVAGVASRISARAIPMTLVFFRGLGVSCYIGGVGGARYLMQAQLVADQLDVAFPPIAVWRPHDRYYGVGQIGVLIEVERMSRIYGGSKYAEVLDRLKSLIAQIQKKLGELTEQKEKVVEELKQSGNNEELIKQAKSIAATQSQLLKSSGFSVLSRDLKILGNAPIVQDMFPSIIDYAVNVGLKETSDQWIIYLNENGDLCSDVHLEPVMSRIMKSDFGLLTDCSCRADEL